MPPSIARFTIQYLIGLSLLQLATSTMVLLAFVWRNVSIPYRPFITSTYCQDFPKNNDIGFNTLLAFHYFNLPAGQYGIRTDFGFMFQYLSGLSLLQLNRGRSLQNFLGRVSIPKWPFITSTVGHCPPGYEPPTVSIPYWPFITSTALPVTSTSAFPCVPPCTDE
jgi:hypothetical protein